MESSPEWVDEDSDEESYEESEEESEELELELELGSDGSLEPLECLTALRAVPK